MGIRTARNHGASPRNQNLGQRPRVIQNVLGVLFKGWLQSLPKAHGFARDDVHQGATLHPREDSGIEFFGQVFFVGENHTPPWAAQGFMGGGGGHIGKGHGGRIHPAGHEAREVGHVHHEIRPDFVGNLTETGKIHHTGVR